MLKFEMIGLVSRWTKDWQMRLNVKKCKVIHLEKKHFKF